MIPLRDSAPSHRLPLVTYALIVANMLVFWLELTAPHLDDFIFRYALVPSNISLSDFSSLTPFITSQFLHAGFVHLISNLWFLKIFGDSVEAVLGWIRFLVFYLISGVVAGLAQYIIYPSSDIPMLGASGAVAGILGAYFVFFAHHRIKTLIPVWGFWQIVELPASVMLFYWFVIQLLSGIASLGISSVGSGIAFFAHAGGFIFGYLVTRVMRPAARSLGVS